MILVKEIGGEGGGVCTIARLLGVSRSIISRKIFEFYTLRDLFWCLFRLILWFSNDMMR